MAVVHLKSSFVHLSYTQDVNDGRVLQTINPPDTAEEACHTHAGLVPIAREDAERAARTLKAVSDPTRLQLLSMIQSSPDGEACVCDLTEPLGLTQPTVSHHLKILLDAGVLNRDKRGSWAYFTIAPNKLEAVRALLV
ncbi:helix-turn-helix transcriptional regulator [Actinomadura sp. HBU206391]|nr:helix-turn-helix transcriptional regulator [Actinomadura sp. HBU206391]